MAGTGGAVAMPNGVRTPTLRAARSRAARSRAARRGAVRPSRRCAPLAASADGRQEVTLLDYGVGNVRSVRNAIAHLGYTVREVRMGAD